LIEISAIRQLIYYWRINAVKYYVKVTELTMQEPSREKSKPEIQNGIFSPPNNNDPAPSG